MLSVATGAREFRRFGLLFALRFEIMRLRLWRSDMLVGSQSRTAASKCDTMDIAFGFDDNYVPHVAAAIASIAATATDVSSIRFILLHTGVDESRRRLVEAVSPAARFEWIEVHASDLPMITGREAISHINEATFLRLATERVAPLDCHRLIYLDADLTVKSDLRALWEYDLGDHYLGAVHDCIDAPEFADRWGLGPNSLGYFNAGVLLIDLDKVRQEKAFSRALKFILEKNPPLADQDALNWVAWGRWTRIPTRWNVQRHIALRYQLDERLISEAVTGRSAAIVHFTGRDKPWLRSAYHPWAWLYWAALKRTPFFTEVEKKSGIGGLDRLKFRLRWSRRRGSSTSAKPQHMRGEAGL